MVTLIVEEKDSGQRLDQYLRRYMPLAPGSFFYKMLRKKNITRNGSRADGSEKLAAGDEIRLFLSEETIGKFRSRAAQHLSFRPVEVLFENDSVLAVNKPAGILTQRDRSGISALSDDVLGCLLRSGTVTEESLLHYRPSPANRLDRNTSGIVLFGKTLAGQRDISEVIRRRLVRKHYVTLAVGHFPKKKEDRAWLAKDTRNNRSVITASPGEGAEEIRTVFTPLRYFNGNDIFRKGWTLLDVELLTGKPHQIRARISDLGYPAAGDPKYGDPAVNRILRDRYGLRFQLLHAYKAAFRDDGAVPEGLRGKTVEAPFPPLFERILKDLDND